MHRCNSCSPSRWNAQSMDTVDRSSDCAGVQCGIRGLFLGLADKKNSFVLPKLAQVLFHHIVFALSLMELHQRYLMLRYKFLQLCHKLAAHRFHQGRRGQRMMTEKSNDPGLAL